jgi:UDPglucose 6-dehydrogenase
MSKVTVLGAGYVGLTSAACLAHIGHEVCCTDVLRERVALLQQGKSPIVEAGLDEMIREQMSAGRLSFLSDNVAAVTGAEFVFLCVPTPQRDDGRADMRFIESAVAEIGPHLATGAIVVNKSTVPVGSTLVVERVLDRDDVSVVSNPEFLREGTAIGDFLEPDRIVIGAESASAAERVRDLFSSLQAPVLVTDPASAETIKYAANAFLAAKVSFVNAVAALCEGVGADVRDVIAGIGSDHRIGPAYLNPGPGWGGSCFPKDTAALLRIADDVGYEFGLLRGVITANDEQRLTIVDKTRRLVGGALAGRTIGIWGLTFKAGTDDLRNSPALAIAEELRARGAHLQAYDPTVRKGVDGIVTVEDPYEACAGASALVVATEWTDFAQLDFVKVAELMRRPAIVDARNVLDGAALRALGFSYVGVGLP